MDEEIKFISQGISKTGMPWWVASDHPFELEKCPNCGFPLGVKLVNPSPEVEKIRFTFDEGDRSEEFDISNLPEMPDKCNICGWEIKP